MIHFGMIIQNLAKVRIFFNDVKYFVLFLMFFIIGVVIFGGVSKENLKEVTASP